MSDGSATGQYIVNPTAGRNGSTSVLEMTGAVPTMGSPLDDDLTWGAIATSPGADSTGTTGAGRIGRQPRQNLTARSGGAQAPTTAICTAALATDQGCPSQNSVLPA